MEHITSHMVISIKIDDPWTIFLQLNAQNSGSLTCLSNCCNTYDIAKGTRLRLLCLLLSEHFLGKLKLFLTEESCFWCRLSITSDNITSTFTGFPILRLEVKNPTSLLNVSKFMVVLTPRPPSFLGTVIKSWDVGVADNKSKPFIWSCLTF